MRNLILQMSMSIDGYVTMADGSHARPFATESDARREWKLAKLRAAGAHIMGRATYVEMATYWPTSTSDYAAPMNEIPKVVFSKTLERADWHESRIARGDLAEEIAALKAEPGGEIVAWGGAAFAQALSREGLVDEYRLTIHPVAIGAGGAIFADLPAPLRLEELEVVRFEGDAAAIHVLRPST